MFLIDEVHAALICLLCSSCSSPGKPRSPEIIRALAGIRATKPRACGVHFSEGCHGDLQHADPQRALLKIQREPKQDKEMTPKQRQQGNYV